MFQNIITGQYVQGNSILHRTDPRSKFLAIFIFAIVIFLAKDWLSYAVIVSFVCFSMFLSKVSLRFIYKGMKPVLLLVLITFLLHIIINKEGELVYSFGPLKIYEEGLTTGAFIAIRLLSLVVITSLLTLTTTPMELTNGLESILSPFKKMGVPAHELALMMSIALRFIPTLLQETEKVLKAQMARGVDFSSGSLKERIKAITPLLIPLFISAFKRAEELAYAMEARGYRGGEGRTSLRVLQWKMRDTIVVIVTILFSLIIIYLRIVKG